MRFVIQCVENAEVEIEGKVTGKIGKGFLVLAGISEADTRETADRMLEKMIKLRIFEDENGKTNLNLASHGGKILCISQFTLYADVSQGNRPSFVKALGGEKSKPLYDYFCKKLSELRPDTQYGVFGADMKVSLVNNGPFTIMLDSQEVMK